MKNPQSFRNSGAYTSPGTPEYGDSNVGGTPKSAAALMPFNSGRALPSKWDDAERWITSPISGNAACKISFVQSQRRQKSKSGPQDLGHFSNYSPIVPVLEGGSVRNYTANSPLSTGVLIPDGLLVHYDGGIFEKSNSLYTENSVTWSSSVPGLSDMLSEISVPGSQDYKLDSTKGEESSVSRTVSRRDMATQMSPEGSSHSSSKGRLSYSVLTSGISTFLIPDRITPAAIDEIRDVEVDRGTTTLRHSKKQGMRKVKNSVNVDNGLPLSWSIAEASRNTSRLQREEAKITAWENLQKAKAEAAIHKLEMKLEKKRSKSMDKILNKLRASQMKAQAMRNLPLENHATRTHSSFKWISLVEYFEICSFCHHSACRRTWFLE